MKSKRFTKGDKVRIKGPKESKKFLPTDQLHIVSDEPQIKDGQRLLQVGNQFNVVKLVQQKYLRHV